MFVSHNTVLAQLHFPACRTFLVSQKGFRAFRVVQHCTGFSSVTEQFSSPDLPSIHRFFALRVLAGSQLGGRACQVSRISCSFSIAQVLAQLQRFQIARPSEHRRAFQRASGLGISRSSLAAHRFLSLVSACRPS